jgi:hypothetical protein
MAAIVRICGTAKMVELAPSPGTDWTDDERAEIDRLEPFWRSADNWELECGYTDTGDPWCIIYDRRQDRIVLHIARIERCYVIVWPSRLRSVTRATMASAIDIALSELALMT